MDESNRNPYEAPKAALVDVPEVADHPVLAERGARLLASIIDTAILLSISFPLMWLSGYFEMAMQAAARGVQVPFGTTLLWSAIGIAIYVAVQGMPLARGGQTIGKRLLHIRIAKLDGSKPSLATLLGKRYLPLHLVNLIPFAGGLLSLANLLLIFRSDRRCGHDWIAGTRVVKVD